MASPVKGQFRIGFIGAGPIGQTHSMMLRLIADRTEGSVRLHLSMRSRMPPQRIVELAYESARLRMPVDVKP